ncbi:MAG: bacterio-opsin activator domain-containing protein, partial [Halobacteriota archaeon]
MADHLRRREYARFRAAAETTRERLIVRLIGEAGVLPAEQTRIRPGDIDRRRFGGVVYHFLSVRDADDTLSRRTYLSAELARTIDEYAANAGTDPDGRLLDVTPRRIQMLVSEVADRAAETTGEPQFADLSSGDLRRYFARRLLVEEGIDPRIVGTIGGWDRIGALEPYLEPADDADIAAAFDDSDRSATAAAGLPFDGSDRIVGLELDADGRIVSTEGDLQSTLGYEPRAVVGTPFGRLFTDGTRERAKPKKLLSSASRDDFTVETCWFRRADGERTRLSALVCARRGDDHLAGFAAVLWDAEADDGNWTASAFRRAVAAAGQPVCFASSDGEIEYINAAFEALTGYTQSEVVGRPAADILSSGEDLDAYDESLRRTVSDGEPWIGQVTIRRKSGERVHLRQTVAPIGGGEFVVIVATDVTERVRRERALARRCETLEGLEGLVADINAAGRELIDASTRSEIEAAVCASLADSDAYLAAWTGGTAPGDPQLRPREGFGAAIVDDSPFAIDSTALSSALETGHPRVAGGELPADVVGPFEREDVSDARAVGIVPLAYGETTYGLLVVFTDRGTAFGDRERTLLSDLGAHVGHAITAIERRNLLLADTVVELEFNCTDRAAFLVSATAEHDCACSIEAVVPVSEDSLLFYATLSNASPDAFLDTATAAAGVTDGRYIREYDDRSLLEFTVEGSSPALTLTELSATIREGTAEAGEQTLRAEIAQEMNLRSVVQGLQASFPQTTLRAKQAVDRPVETVAEFQDSLTETLTDKQRAALRAAYFAGYFDWPRG